MTSKTPPNDKRISSSSDTPSTSSPSGLSIDLLDFAEYLAEFDLSEDEQLAVLQAYWPIILAFVDLGFGLSPIQQSCGQRAQSADHRAAAPARMVKSDHPDITATQAEGSAP